jgi:flavin-dependent thymidylate synthase
MKVELIGHYGGDETHALSAWTSTHRELTDDRKHRMEKMLKTLAEAGHHTPFEKSYLHFLLDCDVASHIHLLKHRVGVSVNGESARYKQLSRLRFYIPNDFPEELQRELEQHCEASGKLYAKAIGMIEALHGRGRAKEAARFFLPYANETTMDVAFNFRSFMHFQGLRNADDAQKEIKQISQRMLEAVYETGQFDLSLRSFGYEKS